MDISIDKTEVMKNLTVFIDKELDAGLEEALEKACLIVEGRAKVNCPVGDGQLRQSITHQVEGLRGFVGSNVEYAPYVEVGTGIYSTEGTGRQDAWTYWDDKREMFIKTVGMKPQPFLEPALEESRADIEECFRGCLEE